MKMRSFAGYSGADMANLCREAALGPIRSISLDEIENISADQVQAEEMIVFELDWIVIDVIKDYSDVDIVLYEMSIDFSESLLA